MTDDLIARLEAATGPDRELDALIWCHLNGKKYLSHGTPYGEREGRFVQVEYTAPPQRKRQVTNFPRVPHALCVTASIDAALTLATGEAIERVGGAIGILRWAIDMMRDAGASIDALPRFIVIAALRAQEGEG